MIMIKKEALHSSQMIIVCKINQLFIFVKMIWNEKWAKGTFMNDWMIEGLNDWMSDWRVKLVVMGIGIGGGGGGAVEKQEVGAICLG